jgi:Secretion system C-terminal sorting domain
LAYKYSSETKVTIAIPKSFALNQYYPNPFNPSTAISYDVPTAGKALLKVYNALGQEMITLVNETKDTGNLPSGMYFAKLTVGYAVKTIKTTLLK